MHCSEIYLQETSRIHCRERIFQDQAAEGDVACYFESWQGRSHWSLLAPPSCWSSVFLDVTCIASRPIGIDKSTSPQSAHHTTATKSLSIESARFLVSYLFNSSNSSTLNIIISETLVFQILASLPLSPQPPVSIPLISRGYTTPDDIVRIVSNKTLITVIP